MNYVISACFLMILTIGCSYADPADTGPIGDEIRAMSPPEYNPLKTWVFEHVVDKYLDDHRHDDGADLVCKNEKGVVVHKDTIPILEWSRCFRIGTNVGPPRTWSKDGFERCTLDILADLLERVIWPRYGNVSCSLRLRPTFSWEQVVDAAAAENQDQINRAWVALMVSTIIASPVAPPSVGRLLPLLCNLTNGPGWSCPGAPGYPGVGTNTPVIEPYDPGDSSN